LTAFGSAIPAAAKFVLRFLCVSGLVSIACVAVSHVSPDLLPGFLIVLMPTRVVNVNAMMFAATILGVISAYRNRLWGRSLIALLIAGLLFNHRELLGIGQTTLIPLEPRLLTMIVLLTGTAVLIGGAALDALVAPRDGSAPDWFRIVADLAVIGIV